VVGIGLGFGFSCNITSGEMKQEEEGGRTTLKIKNNKNQNAI
jgi:hypothetical protein